MYDYQPKGGSADIPEAVKLAKQGICPKCRGELRDLRGSGFNARAWEKEGKCFWWADDAYTCATSLRNHW